MQQKVYIIIPVYNEAAVIKSVIKEIKKEGFNKIIIIDDGSSDNTSLIARQQKVIVLRHLINRGKGAAVKTGFEAAKLLKTDSIVTFDGDGQHDPKDIKKMLVKINKGYDVIMGSRKMDLSLMPFRKIIYNYIGNFVTWIIYGLWVNDSQCGFRAYSKKAIEAIDTKNDRYEYDSEIIREISRHKLKYAEMPVRIRYTAYSMTKKNKQSFTNGIKTVYKMFISS